MGGQCSSKHQRGGGALIGSTCREVRAACRSTNQSTSSTTFRNSTQKHHLHGEQVMELSVEVAHNHHLGTLDGRAHV